MDWINLIQWPALVVTVAAAWLVGSSNEKRRNIGFWLFLFSNVLWMVWGFHTQTWALVMLQLLLGLLNIRGAMKTESEKAKKSANNPSATAAGQS